MLFYDQVNATIPEEIGGKTAHIVGGGIAGLAAAAFLASDAHMPPANITVYEGLPLPGGAMDAIGDPAHGYVCRGERELEAHMECLWYLCSKVPSLKRPGRTVLDETREVNCREPISSHWRVIERQGHRADYDDHAFPKEGAAQLLRLVLTPEEDLQDKSIRDWFSPSFFRSNTWLMFSRILSFDDYHSVMEMRRYLLRFVHLNAVTPRLEGILHTEYNEFDSIILPLWTWLKELGVRFALGTRVIDMTLKSRAGRTAVTGLAVESPQGRSEIALSADDLVFFTCGSLTQNSTHGDNERPVTWNLDRRDRGLFTLWEKLASRDPKFGCPEKFISWPEKTRWTSFFVTLVDYPEFVDHIETLSGDRRGTGGGVTVKDSGWDLGFIIYGKPFFPDQPENVDVFWGYGLRGNNVGDYVRKPMVDCTGNEVIREFLYHLGLQDTADQFLAHAKVSLAGMPYITSQFMPRAIGDRPRVIPDGCVNLGFLGQFVEVDDDCVFTVETSVRTAMEAVYGLLQLDRPVIPVSPTKFDLRHIASVFRSNLELDSVHLNNLLDPLLAKDLLRLLLPTLAHPRQLVELVNRIPDPTDVRPGT
ncbi:MAG TPA: oleate hydratase [Solirubrobacteraceae bacterium]|nr:oleate hydratase [Solirubrobacteraceae bacterium]